MSMKAEVSTLWSSPKKGGSRSEGKILNMKDYFNQMRQRPLLADFLEGLLLAYLQ